MPERLFNSLTNGGIANNWEHSEHSECSELREF
jgi:hypothetical protein